MTEHEYMTVQEVADLAHVDPQTVRRWFREGRLTKYRVGTRRVLARRSDAEAMIRPDGAPIRPVPAVSSSNAGGDVDHG